MGRSQPIQRRYGTGARADAYLYIRINGGGGGAGARRADCAARNSRYSREIQRRSTPPPGVFWRRNRRFRWARESRARRRISSWDAKPHPPVWDLIATSPHRRAIIALPPTRHGPPFDQIHSARYFRHRCRTGRELRESVTYRKRRRMRPNTEGYTPPDGRSSDGGGG